VPNRPRFALLFDGAHLDSWQQSCLVQLEDCAELAGVIEIPSGPSEPLPWTTAALKRLYRGSESRGSTKDFTGRLAGVPRYGADADAARIRAERFDFLLRLGGGTIPPEIDSASREGVWAFEPDPAANPLPFFREVCDGEDVTHAALVSHGGRGAGATVLEQGWFRTEKRSYVLHRDRMLARVAEWPARACRRLALAPGQPALPASGPAPPPRPAPHRPPLVGYLVRIAWRRLRFALGRLFRHPQWNIGVLHLPAPALLRPGAYDDRAIEWFPLAGRKEFLADPFGLVHGGETEVLCESFQYRTGVGRIVALDYSGHHFHGAPTPAIELPFHVSYPCLVEEDGKVYCIPETCAAKEIELFRADEFPRAWTRVSALVEGFAGVDPTVFHHDGRWWLMCTERGRDEDAALLVWHAPSLGGPWTPHSGNPVKTDVRGARPGGAPFVHEGVLYRPTQDCSKRYGWRVVIQRVTALTASTFEEKPAAVLEPSSGSRYPLGRHTLTPLGDEVLIDGHRAVFVWSALRAFLRIWLGNLLHRPPHPGEAS
jgi:hypothetical protein